jgi:hypothetical protein
MTEPKIFGPKLWFLLHNAAAQYPDNPTQGWKDVTKSMIIGIPLLVLCNKCKSHIMEWMAENSPLDEVVKNNSTLFRYFLDMHNAINTRLGKPTWSLDRAIEKYY